MWPQWAWKTHTVHTWRHWSPLVYTCDVINPFLYILDILVCSLHFVYTVYIEFKNNIRWVIIVTPDSVYLGTLNRYRRKGFYGPKKKQMVRPRQEVKVAGQKLATLDGCVNKAETSELEFRCKLSPGRREGVWHLAGSHLQKVNTHHNIPALSICCG